MKIKMKRGVIAFAAIIMVTMTIPAVMGDLTGLEGVTADPGGPYSGPAGSPIQFDGSNSFVMPPGLMIVSYEWNFGDGNTGTGVSPTHTYASADVYTVSLTVTLTVTDNCDYSATETTTATISPSSTTEPPNILPVAEAGPEQAVNEGAQVSFSGSFSDLDASDTHTFKWDFGDGEMATGNLTPTHVYADDGVYTVTLNVTDDDGGIGTDTLTVTVSNVAPTVEAGADQTVDEDDMVSFVGSFSDPSAEDTHTIEWNFGDGSFSSELNPTHDYDDNGVYTVTLTVTDDDEGVGTDMLMITVNNVAPTVEAGDDQTVDEGDMVSFAGSFTDPSATDTHTIGWDFGDDEMATGTLTPSHAYADNGVYTVTMTVTDDDGGVGTDTLIVTVTNVAPTIDENSFVCPMDPVQVGIGISVSAEFTDPGILDTHTAEWDWGDGLTSEVLVTEGSGTVSGPYTYTQAGVYTITLTVTDDDGGSDSAQYQHYVVVYDPDGGFVTGGGWITSPGAYIPDPSLTGKATFGFVSKYKKGATVPTGQTEFQFHAGDLNFHSTSYDWLVIAGAKAKYKGTGTINGAGNYGFMLTAIDEKLTPSTDVDMFRIKIWNKDDNDGVVYDNQMEALDDADPATALGGGSIVIHKSK
jgi:PKD repeat protein